MKIYFDCYKSNEWTFPYVKGFVKEGRNLIVVITIKKNYMQKLFI